MAFKCASKCLMESPLSVSLSMNESLSRLEGAGFWAELLRICPLICL